MIDIEVEDAAWVEALADVELVVRRVSEATLSFDPLIPAKAGTQMTKLSPTTASAPESGDDQPYDLGPGLRRDERLKWAITVLLTGDAEIQDLNARFRGKAAPTNVLSFPAPESAAPHLGDIALAYGVCAREAAAQGKSLQNHLMHLAAHGVLHLLGYDHETDAEADAMEGMERAVLATLGVPDPYAEQGAPPEPEPGETNAF